MTTNNDAINFTGEGISLNASKFELYVFDSSFVWPTAYAITPASDCNNYKCFNVSDGEFDAIIIDHTASSVTGASTLILKTYTGHCALVNNLVLYFR